MKALVVGGGGFVGPYLVRHLKDELGYEVTVTKTEKETLAMDGAVVKIWIFLIRTRYQSCLMKKSLIICFILQHSHQLPIHGKIQH